MIIGRMINMKSDSKNGRSMLSVPPPAETTDEQDNARKHEKSYCTVSIPVRVENWVLPLSRPRQLLVSSQQDTASLRFWTSSGGYYD